MIGISNMTEEWFRKSRVWTDYRSVLFPRERMERTPEQVDAFIELLELEEGDKVLDQCCGIGRHSLEMARRGLDVTGIDLTEEYIEECRRKADLDSLDIEFVVDDMKDFEREESFDAVINFFSSFGYFEEHSQNMEVLERVYHSLKPGGRFLLDVLGKEIVARVFRERDWKRVEDGLFLEERTMKKDFSYMEKNWILIAGDHVQEYEFSNWVYSAEEVKEMLEQTGFSEMEIYGDLDQSPYDREAERLIAVARK